MWTYYADENNYMKTKILISDNLITYTIKSYKKCNEHEEVSDKL